MGCGGSSTFAEDGSVAVGKGETKIEWNETQPVEVGFYYYTENDAKILVKEFPMDKECAEKVFEETNVVSSSGGVHWVKVVPGTRYAMKYVESGNSAAFPGQAPLELPKKIHAFHTKDDAAKDKLVADLKKDVEKDKEHAYSAEGADDKIKADIDAIATYTTTSQFPDEMASFKKACVSAEDLQPWNTINPVLDIWTEFGYWDEKEGKFSRQLGLSDKVKIKGEEEVRKRGPEVGHKALSTMQKGFKGVIEGAVKGACKKAGPEFEELAPTMAARIDNGDGCVPGVARVEARKLPAAPEGEAAKEEEKKEEGEVDAIEAAAKAEYEADKARIDELKADDKKDWKDEAASYLKSIHGSISAADASADKDKVVIAAVEGFQNPVFVESVEGDEATVTTAANNFQDEASVKVPKSAITSLPDAKDDFLERGRAVVVREGRAFNQAWVKSINGDEVTVEDQFKVTKKAKKADVFTHLTQQHLATRGVALTPNFANLKFWWVAAEDPNVTVRKVKVWRFGAPDTAVTVDLQAVKKLAKPTKENEKPTNEVHVGYSADVEILLGAKYAYNFLIGEATFVDFEQKAESDKACKVFTCNARVEY